MAQESEKKRCVGVLVGGSGLIGGTLVHYFNSKIPEDFDIRAPSSKKLSIRNSQDIITYLQRVKPDFVTNAAMASLDSDAQLAFEINYLTCLRYSLWKNWSNQVLLILHRKKISTLDCPAWWRIT
ncbi:MAG: hypothetical protein D3910_07715 [Candidatus Electrothrix sp. ATG2]|nr:hypothetical protein [Candidatus Electrothrix sp. ATG2]